eukprot:jgi/Phyca11/123391/e_gw1.50.220.1
MADDYVDEEDVASSQSSDVRGHQRTRSTTSITPKRTRDELDVLGEELTSKKTIAARKERQRELRRMRQIRYRKKKNNLALKLEVNTVQLRNEIEKLEEKRHVLSVSVPSNQTMWDIALKYFQVFRFGIQEPPMVLQSKLIAPKSPQLDFLQANMAENVVFNSCCGAGSIIQAWKCQTLWFKDFTVDLEGLGKESDNSLIATTATSFIITERTLEKVFPRLSNQHGKNSVREARLANSVLGIRITARGNARFEWDSALGRVTSLTIQSDLLTPMLRLLGNLEAVSVLFENASISPDFQWSNTCL